MMAGSKPSGCQVCFGTLSDIPPKEALLDFFQTFSHVSMVVFRGLIDLQTTQTINSVAIRVDWAINQENAAWTSFLS